METRLFAVVAFLALTAASMACSGSSSPATQGGADVPAICGYLEAMSQAVKTGSTLNSFSGPEDARRARAEIEAALADVQAVGVDVQAAQIEQLYDAVEDFTSAATKVRKGLTLGQSASTLQANAASIGQIEARISNELDCP